VNVLHPLSLLASLLYYSFKPNFYGCRDFLIAHKKNKKTPLFASAEVVVVVVVVVKGASLEWCF